MSPLQSESSAPIDESRAPFRNLRFLVIDDNHDGRFLVSKTLLRKFPRAIIVEAQSSEAAFGYLDTERLSLVISHRTFEHDGVSLVAEIRRRNRTIPLIVMSGIDRNDAVKAAGADAFLTYDEWLMIGNHVAALLANPSGVREQGPADLATR